MFDKITRMKKFLLFLLLGIIMVSPVVAQTDSTAHSSKKSDGEIKTIFTKSDHRVKIGFYIGPDGAYTQFKGRDVFLVGMSMGMILDHFFSVGLSGYAIVNSGKLWYDNIDEVTKQGAYLYGGYGGLKFEFRVLPSSPVHVNFPILVGAGGLVYSNWKLNNHNYNYNSESLDWDVFFVVEPGVMMELNLVKFMRLDLGISYRYAPNVQLMNTSPGLINNFNANIGLRFGKF